LPGRSQYALFQRKDEDEILDPGELGHLTRIRVISLTGLMTIKYAEVKLQQYLGASSGR